MKKIISTLIFSLIISFAFGQKKKEAEELVNEGIVYHDKGDFGAAITKYDKALELDKDNLFALAERAMTLLSLKKYEDAITTCKKAIKKHPKHEDLKFVYTTCGNALDASEKPDKAIKIYNEGLELFPEYYQLSFNKGVTLAKLSKYDKALLCFQQSVFSNPTHAGSHNAIARVLRSQGNNVPTLFALSRFMTIEPQGNRAKENLELLQKIMKGDVTKNEKGDINININPKALDSKNKNKENDFSTQELLLGIGAALDSNKENVNKSDVEQFIRKFKLICETFADMKKDNKGFYWEFYVPYFIELNEKKLIEPLAYTIFSLSENEKVTDWLENNKTEISKFRNFNKNYMWVKK